MFDGITILAADDDEMNLEMLDIMLSDLDCRLLRAAHGQAALDLLKEYPDTDVILLDLEMPVMSGYEALQEVKRNAEWRDIPVIVLTAGSQEVTRTLSMGADDFITKPYNHEELRLRVMNHVRLKKLSDMAKDMNRILEQEVVRKTAALQQALDLSKEAEYEISLRLGRAAGFRDRETGMHTRRISELSERLGRLAGLPDDHCEVLRIASPLHDVGKIGIPDTILLKPGRLEPEEYDIMKLHTVIGARILADAGNFRAIDAGSCIALQHHERWDGSGYPDGRKEEEIDIFARIVSIADVFDALGSDRPYKKAFPREEIIRVMGSERGKAFDPHLLDLFFLHMDQFEAIRERFADQAGADGCWV